LSSLSMKPYPLVPLNHFTLPFSVLMFIVFFLFIVDVQKIFTTHFYYGTEPYF
jgi:hypothetical protein